MGTFEAIFNFFEIQKSTACQKYYFTAWFTFG